MNIVARLKYQYEVEKLSDLGVDVFLLDVPKWTTKAISPFNDEDLIAVIKAIKKMNKLVYILINKMIHEPDLQALEKSLSLYDKLGVDGLVINDFSVYVLAEKLLLSDKVIYQPGTMNTNSFDVTYLEKRIKGMTLSKEITLDEIKAMVGQQTKIQFSIVGHGFIDMFYSKRKLISLYLDHKHIKGINVLNHTHFTIEEKTRPGIFFPIFEDDFGTHIFRDKKLESFHEIDVLKTSLTDFFIERIFMSDQEYYDAIQAYRDHECDAFLRKYGHEYHKGFYYLPTQKVKGEHYEN